MMSSMGHPEVTEALGVKLGGQVCESVCPASP